MDSLESQKIPNYSILLKENDLNMLPIFAYRKTEKTVPLWSCASSGASRTSAEYCEFEVLVDDGGDSDNERRENASTHQCHICSVPVCASLWQHHAQSAAHRACQSIAHTSLIRAQQMALEPSIVSTNVSGSSHTYPCQPCSAAVALSKQTTHEHSEPHVTSVLYGKLMEALASLYENRENLKTVCEDVFRAITDHESMYTYIQARLSPVRVETDHSQKINSEKKGKEQNVALSTSKSESQAPIPETKDPETENTDITIIAESGAKLKVSFDNYHGFRVFKNKPLCHLCNVVVENREEHSALAAHKEKVQVSVKDKHSFRQLTKTLSHCLLCNSLVGLSNKSHITSDKHIAALQQALVQDDIDPAENAYTTEELVENYIDTKDVLAENYIETKEVLAENYIETKEELAENDVKTKEVLAENYIETKEVLAENYIETKEVLAENYIETKEVLAENYIETKEVLAENYIETKEVLAENYIDTKEVLAENYIETKEVLAENYIETKEVLVENDIDTVESNERNYFCQVCQINIKESTLMEHMGKDTHKDNLSSCRIKRPIKAPTMEGGYCKYCRVTVVGNAKEKSHLRSKDHTFNEWLAEKDTALHYHFKESEYPNKVTCRICNVDVIDINHAIDKHVSSYDHLTKYNKLLKDNLMKVTSEYGVLCVLCNLNLYMTGVVGHTENKCHITKLSNCDLQGIGLEEFDLKQEDTDDTKLKQILKENHIYNRNEVYYSCNLCYRSIEKSLILAHIMSKKHTRMSEKRNIIPKHAKRNKAETTIKVTVSQKDVGKMENEMT